MRSTPNSEIIVFDTAKKIWSQIAKNSIDLNPDFELEVHKKLLNIFQVGDYYHYIFNCSKQQMEYVNENISNVLGYQPEEFKIDFLLENIHPDDLVYFINFENTVTKFFTNLPPDKVLKYKVRYDYRIKKIDGTYIRILQQVVTIQSDENGAVIRVLGVHTDISHLKQNNGSTLSFIGFDGEPSYFDVEINTIFKPSKEVFTKREKQILKLISEGKSSAEIARTLCISKFTVDGHRKNLLKKSSSNNISELITKTFQNGWL